MKIRRARQTDAARISQLCGQLGYPATNKETSLRLRRALKDKCGACLVAESAEHGVIGWVHVRVAQLIEVDRRAEVAGIVVDEQARGQGAGRLLLEAAERWARKRGCAEVALRSNIVRTRAHQFYGRCGFEHYKTQKAFRKKL